MRRLPLLLVAGSLLVPGTAFAQAGAVRSGASADSAAVAVVRRFFAANDARDFPVLERLLLPTARIVHWNGSEEDAPQFLLHLHATGTGPRRVRELSDFETQDLGSVVLVGLINHVVFSPEGAPPTDRRFRETWALTRTPAGLRVARAQYTPIAGGQAF